MGSRRARHEKCARSGPRRPPCSQISQRRSSAPAGHSRRYVPIEDCAVDLQISSATPPVVGIEEVLPDMTAISEAVILMAGEGSRLRQGYGGQARLRGSDSTFLKPFVLV